jgi:hypothetical protein
MGTMKKQKKTIFLLTDGCMWEMNKQTGKSNAHAIEVVDIETGAVRYIKSGSQIQLVSGQITEARDQSEYNEQP